jgi:hypothetical protein
MSNVYADRQVVICNKNYKAKKSIEVMLPQVILKLFQCLRIPNRLQLFNRELNVEEEIEFSTQLNFATYKDLLNSDLTILLGMSLMKNPRIQILMLCNLNLYDIDIQTLTTNATNGNLNELKKLSFKRSCFLDKIKELDKLLPALPYLAELNLSCTNLLA